MVKFDGTADEIDTGYPYSDGDLVIEASVKFDSVAMREIYIAVMVILDTFLELIMENGSYMLIMVIYSHVYRSRVTTVDSVFDTRLEYTASTNTWVAEI